MQSPVRGLQLFWLSQDLRTPFVPSHLKAIDLGLALCDLISLSLFHVISIAFSADLPFTPAVGGSSRFLPLKIFVSHRNVDSIEDTS